MRQSAADNFMIGTILRVEKNADQRFEKGWECCSLMERDGI